MNVCRDCKFHEEKMTVIYNHFNVVVDCCIRKEKIKLIEDKVTGETESQVKGITYCAYQRNQKWFQFWKCGADGKYFKRKPNLKKEKEIES
jgi:hypothetical protein